MKNIRKKRTKERKKEGAVPCYYKMYKDMITSPTVGVDHLINYKNKHFVASWKEKKSQPNPAYQSLCELNRPDPDPDCDQS